MHHYDVKSLFDKNRKYFQIDISKMDIYKCPKKNREPRIEKLVLR